MYIIGLDNDTHGITPSYMLSSLDLLAGYPASKSDEFDMLAIISLHHVTIFIYILLKPYIKETKCAV